MDMRLFSAICSRAVLSTIYTSSHLFFATCAARPLSLEQQRLQSRIQFVVIVGAPQRLIHPLPLLLLALNVVAVNGAIGPRPFASASVSVYYCSSLPLLP